MTSVSTTELFDIDAHLNKLSGEMNYMSQLKVITGDTHDVVIPYWKPKHEQNCKCDENIYKLLQYLANIHSKKDETKYKQIVQVKNDYEKEYRQMNLVEKGLYKDKKGRWHIGAGYYPEFIVKSQWFIQVRFLEKSVNDLLADVLDKNYMKDTEGDFNKYVSTTLIAVKAVFAKHPEFIDIKKILGCELSDNVLESFIKIKQFATIIINNYMYPMYNVHEKIMKSYDKLDKVFKTKGAQQMMASADQKLNTDQNVAILERFIVAKYRKEITGNAEHYTKLFMSVVGDEDVAGSISGPRLLELLDSIDLDIINSNKNAFKFANSAKDMIRKLITGESISAEESIKEIKELFKEGEESSRVEELADENNIL